MPRRVAAVVEQSWHRVPGGTAVSTVRTLEAIDRHTDWEVTGVAAAHRRPPAPEAAPTVGVRSIPLPRDVLYESWHHLRHPHVQRFTGAVDVVHATGGAIPPSGGAALVVTIHDLAFLHRPGHFTRRGVAFMGRAFELARRRADLVLVPSATTATDCVDHGVVPERVRIVPWGVEPVLVDDPARADVRRRFELPERFVLWVGTAEPRKNLRGLLAAHRRSGGAVPLVLVGPQGWGTDVSSLVDETPGVRHVGRVSGADLAVLYDLAAVFVYPSLLEGFGMPVLEAMAQGTAVVTSAGTATEEVVGDAGVVVDPTDVGALATAIGGLLTDDGERHRVAAAARRRAATMTWDATATATVRAYEEVVS